MLNYIIYVIADCEVLALTKYKVRTQHLYTIYITYIKPLIQEMQNGLTHMIVGHDFVFAICIILTSLSSQLLTDQYINLCW